MKNLILILVLSGIVQHISTQNKVERIAKVVKCETVLKSGRITAQCPSYSR